MTDLQLHVRDHGGEGPPLLLLHGAGRSHADWDDAVPSLLPHHRVLAADLPGHGASPACAPGGWSFEATTEAVDAALSAHGAADALPVGHSLGGIVAAHLAANRPGTPAAVNLDGFWWGGTGSDEDRERIGEIVRASAGAVAPAEYLSQQRAHAGRFGIAAERAERTARAAARQLPDGRWQTLPERDTALALYDALDALDLFALFRRAKCPLLLVRAERAQPPGPPGMEWFEAFLAEYREELTRSLAGLCEDRPQTVTVTGFDGTHAMLLEEPEKVASAIGEFAAGVR
ncbi:alpha/beta fold hydrolase [Streptomyces sp. CA-294286]|uniref:alpha/beta fold hydrolase n=1 Tax=Streptomyces sp. CA-294286 TaxID=3240070 RepID=UPI003D8D6FC1